MEKKNTYFLKLIIASIGLFVLDAASMIYAVIKIKTFNESQNVDNSLALAYLVLHFVLIAVLVYYAFRAYMTRPSLMNVLMYDEKGNPIKKSHNVALTLSIIFGAIALFFLLGFFGALSFLRNVPRVLSLALINVGISVAVVSLFFFFYKMPENEKSTD